MDHVYWSLTFSMLLSTYDVTSHLSTVCYVHVLSATYEVIPCAISVCRQSFISLNFAGLLSIVALISTQFSMMSHSENEAVNAASVHQTLCGV